MAITNLFDAIFGQDRFKADPNRPPSLMNFDEFGTKGAPTELQQRQEQRQSEMVGDVTSKLIDPFIYQYEKASRPPVQYQEGQAVQDVASQNIMPNIAGVMGEGAKMVKGFAQEPIETTANLTKTVGTLGSGLAQKLTGTNFDPNSVEIVDSVIEEMADTYNDRYGTLDGFREAFAENPEQVIADATLLGLGAKGGTQLLKGVYDRVTDKQFVNNVIDRISDLKVPVGMSISPRRQSPFANQYFEGIPEGKLTQYLQNDDYTLMALIDRDKGSGGRITQGKFADEDIYRIEYGIADTKDPMKTLGFVTLMQDATTGQFKGLIDVKMLDKEKGSGRGLIESFAASDPKLFDRDFTIQDIDASAVKYWEKMGTKRYFDNDPVVQGGLLIDTDDPVAIRRQYDVGGELNEQGEYVNTGKKLYSVIDLDKIPNPGKSSTWWHGTLNDLDKLTFGKEFGENFLGDGVYDVPDQIREVGVHFGTKDQALKRMAVLQTQEKFGIGNYKTLYPIKEGEGKRLFKEKVKVSNPLYIPDDLGQWTPHRILNQLFNEYDDLPKGFIEKDRIDYNKGDTFAKIMLEDPDTGNMKPTKVYLTHPFNREVESINQDVKNPWYNDPDYDDPKYNDADDWKLDLKNVDPNYKYTFNDLSHEKQSEWMNEYLKERGYDHIKYPNQHESFDNVVGEDSIIVYDTNKFKNIDTKSWAQMIAPLGGIDAMMGETPQDVPTEDDIPRQGLL